MNISWRSVISGLAAAGAFASGMALSAPSQAKAVDLLFVLNLDGMATGTCAGTVCPTPLGTVTVTGDTTSTLDFAIKLAADVNFVAGNAVWFSLSAGNNPVDYTLEAPASGTVNGSPWIWLTPFSTGSFVPGPGADFPGPYTDKVECSAEVLCGTELNFIASGANADNPFVIGSPRGAGAFLNFPVPFVTNLSIAPGTPLCQGEAACTGLVGAPESSTWGMMLLGFAGLGFLGYRKAFKGALTA
jgi:hypothetical protein